MDHRPQPLGNKGASDSSVITHLNSGFSMLGVTQARYRNGTPISEESVRVGEEQGA